MTIPEAAQLVLEAGTIGESGDVMILDMGRPIRIAELAEDMISLSGFRPYEEIASAKATLTGKRRPPLSSKPPFCKASCTLD